MSVDAAVFLWLNHWVGHFPALDWIAQGLISDYLVPIFSSLTLLGLWFYGKGLTDRERHQRAVMVAVLGLALANLAVMTINHFYFRPRPFATYDVELLFYKPTDSSFPANPVAVAFAAATGVWRGNRRIGAVLYGLASAYGLARIYAGIFYPLDVIGGALIGLAATYVVSKAFRLIEPLPTLVLKLARFFYLA